MCRQKIKFLWSFVSETSSISETSPLRQGNKAEGAPVGIGVALFPEFELLDWIGPIEALTTLSRNIGEPDRMKLYILSSDSKAVSSGPGKGSGTCFQTKIKPNCTYKEPPPDLEVLIIPGGFGTGIDGVYPEAAREIVEFLKERFHSLKYLITICTGAGIAARAGVLDGLKATTNKQAWHLITPLGEKTYWVAQARWVWSSEKIVTTSGVSAGIDGCLSWMSRVYGESIANAVCESMEYERKYIPNLDMFCETNHCIDVPPLKK